MAHAYQIEENLKIYQSISEKYSAQLKKIMPVSREHGKAVPHYSVVKFSDDMVLYFGFSTTKQGDLIRCKVWRGDKTGVNNNRSIIIGYIDAFVLFPELYNTGLHESWEDAEKCIKEE